MLKTNLGVGISEKEFSNIPMKSINIEMADLSIYMDNKLELPKENDIIEIIDKNKGIGFKAIVTHVNDKSVEIKRID